MTTVRTQLDNGLEVILKESRVAPVASFWIFYRVGSRNEMPGQTGISHWVEHMLFKGTERFPSGEFDKAVSRAGGFFNGMTSQDWTTYFETFPAERIDLALQVESDRMVNAAFDPAETELERTVIISEREGSENSYLWLLNEEVQAAAFRLHPYHHSVIGWKSDLEIIQRDDLYRHYRTFYTPNNAVAVAVGDFDAGEMLAKIEAAFGPLGRGPEVPAMRLTEPAQLTERRVLLRGNDPTGYLMLACHAPAARDDDFFATAVLDAALGGATGLGIFGGSTNNRSTRLYRALVDTQLAVGAESSFRPTIDPHLFTIFATLGPESTHQQVEEVIWAEIEQIQADGITSTELEKAVKQTKAQFAYSSESVTNQAYWTGFAEVVADPGWLDAWLDQLEAVTVEDVQRVAARYLRRDRQVAGWYTPEGS